MSSYRPGHRVWRWVSAGPSWFAAAGERDSLLGQLGMVGETPAGTATLMRPETVRRYAAEAGFTGFEILPIEDKFWRFYLLTA